MLIQADDVVAQMERQMLRLRQSLHQKDEAAVKEAAAVIESYCQLLKGSQQEGMSVPQALQEKEIQPLQKPAFSAPAPHMTERQQKTPQETPLQQKPSEKRNLLDF